MHTTGVPTDAVGVAGIDKSRLRWARAHLAGLTILALWVVWLGMTLWSAPVHASGAALKQAAVQGRITEVRRVSSPPALLSASSFLLDRDQPTDGAGDYLEWTTSDGRHHWTNAWAVPGPIPATAGQSTSDSGSSYGDAVTAYVQQRTHYPTGTQLNWFAISRLALVLFALGSMLGGDAPRRGSRWFWFWIFSLPFGIGILWFAGSERLRDPAARKYRWNGLQGFLLTMAGCIIIQFAIAAGPAWLNRL